MIGSSPNGFFPVAIYARRARLPLAEKLDVGTQSWDMLGTNLSFKVAQNPTIYILKQVHPIVS